MNLKNTQNKNVSQSKEKNLKNILKISMLETSLSSFVVEIPIINIIPKTNHVFIRT